MTIALVTTTAALALAQRPAAPPLDALDDAAWYRALEAASEDDACVTSFEGCELDAALGLLATVPSSDAPETRLLGLAALAASDDPDLAPAAARAARLIVEALSASGLDAREASLSPEITEAFRAIAEDASARSDIQDTAAYIVGRLGELGRAEAP